MAGMSGVRLRGLQAKAFSGFLESFGVRDWGLGLRGLGFRGLGFRGLGFRARVVGRRFGFSGSCLRLRLGGFGCFRPFWVLLLLFGAFRGFLRGMEFGLAGNRAQAEAFSTHE